MLEKEVTAEELQLAKESIAALAAGAVRDHAEHRRDDSARSTCTTFRRTTTRGCRSGSSEMTSDQIFEATKAHLQPDDMRVIAVGDRKRSKADRGAQAGAGRLPPSGRPPGGRGRQGADAHSVGMAARTGLIHRGPALASRPLVFDPASRRGSRRRTCRASGRPRSARSCAAARPRMPCPPARQSAGATRRRPREAPRRFPRASMRGSGSGHRGAPAWVRRIGDVPRLEPAPARLVAERRQETIEPRREVRARQHAAHRSASPRHGERKSSPGRLVGDRAVRGRSCVPRAPLRRSARRKRVAGGAAQSNARPRANAVWLCSPVRIGWRSLGSQVRKRSAPHPRAARARRASGPRRASSHSRSSAQSWSTQASP